jgi:hypothetical protein
MVKTWFRFGYGRSETEADACTIETLATNFAGSEQSTRALLLGLTQSDAFAFRTVAEGATP